MRRALADSAGEGGGDDVADGERSGGRGAGRINDVQGLLAVEEMKILD